MQSIESRIRKLYIGSVVFIHIIAFTIITISATYLRDIFYVEKRITAGVIIASMLIYIISVWKGVMNPKKIIVNTNCIKVYNAKSSYEIAFSEVDKIQKEKTQIFRTHGVPLTDGFIYSKIILKQGKTLIISPDKFDNYTEIMAFINVQIDNRT